MLMLFQSMVTDREELSIPQAYDEGSTEGIYFNTGLLYNFLKFFCRKTVSSILIITFHILSYTLVINKIIFS